MFYPERITPRSWHLGLSSKNTQRATGPGPTTHYIKQSLKRCPRICKAVATIANRLCRTRLVETLAVLVSDFFQALATGGSFDALLFFRRLFEALTLLDIGNDAVLFARLGETLESAFERFVGLNNYADHDYPLVKLEIRFWIAKYIYLHGFRQGYKKTPVFRHFFSHFYDYNLRNIKDLCIFLLQETLYVLIF